MEATKAALESERKIQQLQMQAINALWKKVSTLQAAGECPFILSTSFCLYFNFMFLIKNYGIHLFTP